MLKSKMLNGVNAIFAGYVTHYYLVGEIMVSSGTITAQSDRFTVPGARQGGAWSAPNVIAEDAVLDREPFATTRPDARQQIIEGLRRMSAALASLHNADIAVDCPEGSPPVVNTNHETVIARRAAQPVVEPAAVVEQDYPSMGTENFSYYLDEIPGYYGRL